MGLSVRISSNDIGIWYCEGQPNSIIGGRQTLLTTLRGVKNLDRLSPMVIHHDVGASILPSVEISSTVSEWAAISTRRNVNKILASCNDIMDGHRALAPVVDARTRQWIHSIHQDVTDVLFRLVYVGVVTQIFLGHARRMGLYYCVKLTCTCRDATQHSRHATWTH